FGTAQTAGAQGAFTGAFGDMKRLALTSAGPFSITKKITVVHQGAGTTGLGAWGMVKPTPDADEVIPVSLRDSQFASALPSEAARMAFPGASPPRDIRTLNLLFVTLDDRKLFREDESPGWKAESAGPAQDLVWLASPKVRPLLEALADTTRLAHDPDIDKSMESGALWEDGGLPDGMTETDAFAG